MVSSELDLKLLQRFRNGLIAVSRRGLESVAVQSTAWRSNSAVELWHDAGTILFPGSRSAADQPSQQQRQQQQQLQRPQHRECYPGRKSPRGVESSAEPDVSSVSLVPSAGFVQEGRQMKTAEMIFADGVPASELRTPEAGEGHRRGCIQADLKAVCGETCISNTGHDGRVVALTASYPQSQTGCNDHDACSSCNYDIRRGAKAFFELPWSPHQRLRVERMPRNTAPSLPDVAETSHQVAAQKVVPPDLDRSRQRLLHWGPEHCPLLQPNGARHRAWPSLARC